MLVSVRFVTDSQDHLEDLLHILGRIFWRKGLSTRGLVVFEKNEIYRSSGECMSVIFLEIGISVFNQPQMHFLWPDSDSGTLSASVCHQKTLEPSLFWKIDIFGFRGECFAPFPDQFSGNFVLASGVTHRCSKHSQCVAGSFLSAFRTPTKGISMEFWLFQKKWPISFL